jgi:hypothetical protein
MEHIENYATTFPGLRHRLPDLAERAREDRRILQRVCDLLLETAQSPSDRILLRGTRATLILNGEPDPNAVDRVLELACAEEGVSA